METLCVQDTLAKPEKADISASISSSISSLSQILLQAHMHNLSERNICHLGDCCYVQGNCSGLQVRMQGAQSGIETRFDIDFKYLGSSVRETEISDVATTSTLTSLSLKTLNTCTARSNCLKAHRQVAGLVQHMHALVYEPFTPDNSLIENGPPLTGNRTGPACALKLCPARSHLS